jgi:hypothetical protein
MFGTPFVMGCVAAFVALNLLGCGNASSAPATPQRDTGEEAVSSVEPTATAAPMYIKAEEICSMIKPEEAPELFGRQLSKPPAPSDHICCFWLKGGGGVRIENIKRPDPSLNGYTGARLAHELAAWMAKVGSEGVVLDGIADGAVQGPKLDRYMVFIVRGPHLFRVETLGGFDDDTAEVLAGVANKIGPRLEQLNGRPL